VVAAAGLGSQAAGLGQAGRRGPRQSAEVISRGAMLVPAFSQALGQTLALIATFGGIGIIVNLLILYVVAQVFAEHKQNQEREPGADY
jgi:hypothetical protein